MTDDRIAMLLQSLADKLGVTATHLWGVMVAQARVDFYVSVFQYVVIAICCYGSYRLVRWYADRDTDEAWAILVAPIVIGVSLMTIVAFCTLDLFVASIANPEYWALKQILSAVKPSK